MQPRLKFRRRRHRRPLGLSPPASAPCEGAGPAPGALGAGSYVTDGRSLFRVQHGSLHGLAGELFLELEDCRTLDLVLCPAHVLDEAEIRWVVPVEAETDGRAAFVEGLTLDR